MPILLNRSIIATFTCADHVPTTLHHVMGGEYRSVTNRGLPTILQKHLYNSY